MPTPIGKHNLLASFAVPTRGVLRNWPVHTLPENALFDASNVTVREGCLQPRAGLTLFGNQVLTGRPTSIFQIGSLAAGAFEPTAFENTAFQIAANTPGNLLVVGTTRKIYVHYGGVFNDITGGTLAADDWQMARFTSMYINSLAKVKIFHVNGKDVMKEWDGAAATFSNTAGSPPVFTDIAAISDHVVGIYPPYTVGWCNNQDPGTWPAANSRTISMRGDRVVAIRAMGQYGGVLYKTDSIWTIFPQGGAESTFFVFNDIGSYEGPAGPAAVVDAHGLHIWLTDHGRVGTFDGAQVRWVADGVWPIVKSTIDKANANRVFGVFDPDNFEVTFYYPREGDGGDCKGMVTVILPRPADGIMDFIAFPGVATFPMSGGGDTRLDTHLALVADKNGIVYSMQGVQDHLTSFNGYIQTGMNPTDGLEMHALGAMEVYVNRAQGFGSLTIAPVTSFILDTPTGTVGPAQTVNMNTAPVYDVKGADVRGRFFGVRVAFTSPATFRYYGARLATRELKG